MFCFTCFSQVCLQIFLSLGPIVRTSQKRIPRTWPNRVNFTKAHHWTWPSRVNFTKAHHLDLDQSNRANFTKAHHLDQVQSCEVRKSSGPIVVKKAWHPWPQAGERDCAATTPFALGVGFGLSGYAQTGCSIVFAIPEGSQNASRGVDV